MISMAQLSGHRTYAALRPNKFCISHEDAVRQKRTYVNVESVHSLRDLRVMANGKTLGAQLRELQQASGLSYDAIAERADYAGRSSVQRYFSEDFDDEMLSPKVAKKLAKAFAGTVVSPDSIMAFAGLPASNASVVKFEGASAEQMPRDVPIYGTALGAPRDFDGNAVEQTTLNTGDVIGYLPRPGVLSGQQNVYGLYVQGSSMAPRYEEGESAFVSSGGKPPRIGDDVVVYLRDDVEDDGQTASAVLIKRLVRRTANYTELEQFNPPMVFRIEACRILRVDRVIPWAELLS